ncbi:ovarian cancer G-protein coupled receptor 1-like [Rhinophrynus dorsalis]
MLPLEEQLQNHSTLSGTANHSNCSVTSLYSTLFIVTYSVSFIIGVPANLMGVYGMYRLIKPRFRHAVYLLNLTIADLLYLSILPLWIVYFKQDHYWTLGDVACKASGTFYFINMYASIYFLCCIAIDRFIGIVYPIRFRTFQTVKCNIIVSLAGWVIIILCQIPIILSMNIKHSQLCYEWIMEKRSHAIVNCFAAIFGFLTPTFILCFSYQASIRSIRKASMSPHGGVWIKCLLLSCLITFLSCFGPYHCLSLFHAIHVLIYGPNCEFVQSIHKYYRVSVALTSLNTVLDPMLYIFISEDIRKQVKRICCL